ncbi:MAG: CoB--CoM heterodisulfide reductase iron-sulfur subunit A family protein [Promethearchaeota archaeon]
MDEEMEPRIGVFVCHCGSNIGGLIDCKKLAEKAREFPNVVYTEDNLYTCSETGLTNIKKAVEEHDLNRVVVCSCTPRTHEPLFRETIREVGLNPYLFQFVNIREQCTWVHMKNPEAAFNKAIDLIRMGVSKAAKLEPLEDILIEINPSALVIGGGIAGMAAALSLNNQGYETYLIEKEDELGGLLTSLYKTFPKEVEAATLLKDYKEKIQNAKNLTVYTKAVVEDINGYIGNFTVSMNHDGTPRTVNVGAIIVAVGAVNLTPFNLFGYDGKIRITQLELERFLKEGTVKAKNIVMIQCVGARNEERTYCSNVCCMSALKNALILKERNPDRNIIILFRNLYTPGIEGEEYYRRARESGILFIRYSPEKELVVEEDHVDVFNEYIGEIMSIPYDLLVLSTPLIASPQNKNLAQLLKVPLEENNFFLEAHVKLRPNDFATDGVYVCGSAKWPATIAEAISQGHAAAARAATVLSQETIKVEGNTAFLPDWNKNLCVGCEICVKICPFNAIQKDEDAQILIIEALCKGCGTCAASCPQKAIVIKHFTNDQILSEIHALGGPEIT